MTRPTRDDRLLAILRDASDSLRDSIRSADAVPLDVVVLGVINRLDSQRQVLDELAAEIEADRRERLECAAEDRGTRAAIVDDALAAYDAGNLDPRAAALCTEIVALRALLLADVLRDVREVLARVPHRPSTTMERADAYDEIRRIVEGGR